MSLPSVLANARLVAVLPGEKRAYEKGWPDIALSPDEMRRHLAAGGNIALRLGRVSGDLVDADLDCHEAMALADIYLPATGAEFGRASKPRCHRLYRSPRAIYASFGDPLAERKPTMLELRADGRDGGAHLTLIPPSVADDERREWHGGAVAPASVDAPILARRMAWLATGCLVMRHLSEHAARGPGPDLPDLLWEADHDLGRAAYRWLGMRAPDEPHRHPKPRRSMSRAEIELAEVVAAIPNNFDWVEWNRLGMAIFSASGGSEEGFIAFDDLSARSARYDPYVTRERWRNYRRSPPNRIGLGTLVHVAQQYGWRRGAA